MVLLQAIKMVEGTPAGVHGNPYIDHTAAFYRTYAFKRYQIPFGADQCKRMTRWALHVPHALSGARWEGYDAMRAQNLDMYHDDSGAEGLTAFAQGMQA